MLKFLMPALGFAAFIATLIYLDHNSVDVCDKAREVAAVGGCSQYGECGVRFTDGSFGQELKPVVGKKICQRRHSEWKK